MIVPDVLARVTAEAVVPEQIVAYVGAVSGARPRLTGSCVGYETDGDLVLVGYPLHDPLDGSAMAEAVDRALRLPGLRKMTVIGPVAPPQAPPGSLVAEDSYYALPLPPPPPGQKLRNLLRRAERELAMERGRRLETDHLRLVDRYISQRQLAPGTQLIFRQLPRYLRASGGSLVLSARLRDGRLAGFAVGDYSSLHTACYMFSFRDAELAPPGSSDLLLSGLLREAAERGQKLMNLGLGINPGVRFFKLKWGAFPFLPCVEVRWDPVLPDWVTRLKGFFGR